MTCKGYKHSEEVKRKIGNIHRGKTVSIETKEKLRQSNLGKNLTEEHKNKISKSLAGNTRTLGYKHTEEAKKKMSIAHKGRKNTSGYKPTKEHKKKISEGNLGHKHTKEAKRKISESKKGKTKTEETKRKISESRIIGIKAGRINPENHGISGNYYSKKNKKKLHYRSQLELNWYQLLEQMNKVKKYQVEPCIIPYEYEGYTHNYLPDLRIVYSDGTSELVEIKPEGGFFRKNPKNIAKWKSAEEWCKTRKRNITFKVIGYEELN